MKTKGPKFDTEQRERIFLFLQKIAKNIPPDVYKENEREALQVIELPSLRAEYAAKETFKTLFISNPANFQAKAEFWLQTVYFKLEKEKVETLFKIATAMQKQQEGENKRHPFTFLLAAMNFEPDPRLYALNIKKEKEEKALKSIDWDKF
jgi:hypothetical protein